MAVVFVFGSNLAGRHGKGAALHARQCWGAIYGQGQGRQGDSYAIPTKDEQMRPLSLEVIEGHMRAFVEYAVKNPLDTFILTPVATGLAGHSRVEIWNMIASMRPPNNVALANSWMYETP